MANKKNRYKFVVVVAEKTGTEPAKSKELARYEFWATGRTSALRTASTWYNKNAHRWFDGWPPFPGFSPDWRPVDIETNTYGAQVSETIFLVLFPAGEPEADGEVEALETMLADIRRDPTPKTVLQRYPEVVEQLGRYFQHQLAKTGGNISAEIQQEADLVYDLPHAPAMLSRVLGRTPGELRKLLGRIRYVKCPRCGVCSRTIDQRRKGGYTVPDLFCIRCNVAVINCSYDEYFAYVYKRR